MPYLFCLTAAVCSASRKRDPTSQASGLLHYALPPDKLTQAYALYRIDVSLYFITTLYVFVVLWLMLRTHTEFVCATWPNASRGFGWYALLS